MKCNYKHRGARLTQAGFGLIEILISSAIVSVLGLSVAFYSSTTELTVGDTAKSNFDCLNHSVSVLDEMLSRGGPTRVPPYSATWHPWNGNPAWSVSEVPDPANAVAVNDSGILTSPFFTNNWPASAPPILAQGGAAAATPATSMIYSANSLLIDDRIRLLSLFYNNPATNYCTGFQVNNQLNTIARLISPGLNNLLQNIYPGVDNLTTEVQVQAYDLATGNPVPCSERPLWLYPRNRAGMAAPPTKADGFDPTQPKFRKPISPTGVNYRNDRGFLVSVRTTFQDSKLNTKTCTYTQRYAHQLDDIPPARPAVAITVRELAFAGNANAGPANRNTATLQIQGAAAGTAFERGTVLICKDRSLAIATKSSAVQCYYNPLTMPAPGPGPQAMGPPLGVPSRGRIQETALLNGDANNLALPDRSIRAFYYNNPAFLLPVPANMTVARPTTWGTEDWVRCEQLRVCGSAPTGPATLTFAGDNPTITLNYANVRSECVVRVEVAAMDAAGNLHNDPTAGVNFNSLKLASGTVSSVYGVTPHTGFPVGTTYSSLVTPRPMCGAYCAPGANWPLGATGYYVAEGGCCVGLGCVRGRNGVGVNLTESLDPAPL